MTMPTACSSRSTSFHESEKIDGTTSWDAFEWTKIEPVTKSVARGNLEFLLEAEEVLAEEHGVVLLNKDEAGTLYVTNFRLVFVGEGNRSIDVLGTIPLSTIEKFDKHAGKQQPATRQMDKSPSIRLLQITGKDMRIICFGFRPRTKQRRAVYDALSQCTRPEDLLSLYAFAIGPSKYGNRSQKVRLIEEYFRLLGADAYHNSSDTIEDDSFTVPNNYWRISTVNSNYTICTTYPFAMIVPQSISDEEIVEASSFRAKCRLPVISWCHPGNGAVIARSSQPLVGIMMNLRSNADEKLVAALCSQLHGGQMQQRKLYIADARPRKNALANGAMGGGSESSSNYFRSEIFFLGIDNIHSMRESFNQLREYIDTHGAASSDGQSSFLRHGGWTWGRGNVSSMLASVTSLGDSGWLIHVQTVLAGSVWIAARVALESASVLIHCSDGWDRTTQLVSLSSLLLDPYYRTLKGFQALIEKDWLAFGHPFADRLGMPTVAVNSTIPADLSRQSSGLNFSSSLRQSSGAIASPVPLPGQVSHNTSPIFLQWVDCVAQLLRMYPVAFEFSSAFLVDLLDCFLSCRFGNFLCNSEKERQQTGVWDACGCVWAYLDSLRVEEGSSHVHFNPLYDPRKHNHLLPPAAALSPTLWPQFHLRWACPAESKSTDMEAHSHLMLQKFTTLQKEKELMEKKAKEAADAAARLRLELKRERQLRKSATDLAKRVGKENAGMQRAMQSMGCKIQFSSGGDCRVDIESLPSRTPSWGLNSCESDDEGLSVSVERVCGNVCPSGAWAGICRWPDGGCTLLGSQIVGLKANYDAIDQLSIHESYF